MIPAFNTIPALRSVIFFSLIVLSSCKSSCEPLKIGEFPQSIPFIDELRVDGNPEDWPDAYTPIRIMSDISGNIPDHSDMVARFRLAWSPEGLLIFANVCDDSIYEDKNKFWNGDGMELFVSPARGSFQIVQISIRPSFDLQDTLTAVMHFDHRRSDSLKQIPPKSFFRTNRTPDGYQLEGLIPLDMLGIIEPKPGMEMAVQLYINDADMEMDSTNFSLPWYPARESYRNPYAFHRIRFSESAFPVQSPEIRAFIKDEKSLIIKVLSDQADKDKGFEVRAGNLNRQFNLQPEQGDLFTQQWKLPFKKLTRQNEGISFLCCDSLYFRIETCMLHHVYEDLPEPNRFEDEIRIFEIIDHFRPPPDKAVLFTGSSTIHRWFNLEHDLPGLSLINRGFGGSTMNDLNYYRERIVFSYTPSFIFIYEGDNDIARGVSPLEFINDCQDFILSCSNQIPEAEIYFMSIKPSLARWNNWGEMQKANQMLMELAEQNEKVHYLDIASDMLNKDGVPKKDIFANDRLHLNDNGYEILTDALGRILYK